MEMKKCMLHPATCFLSHTHTYSVFCWFRGRAKKNTKRRQTMRKKKKAQYEMEWWWQEVFHRIKHQVYTNRNIQCLIHSERSECKQRVGELHKDLHSTKQTTTTIKYMIEVFSVLRCQHRKRPFWRRKNGLILRKYFICWCEKFNFFSLFAFKGFVCDSPFIIVIIWISRRIFFLFSGWRKQNESKWMK